MANDNHEHRLTAYERVMLYSVPSDDGCRMFTRCQSTGYGQVFDRRIGRSVYAHRIVAEHHFGPPPDDKPFVLHSCDNPGCVEIAHLRYGTPAENMADRNSRDRHARGERTPWAKLTDADIPAIRVDDRIRRVIAAEYGVSRQTINDIKARRTWKHV